MMRHIRKILHKKERGQAIVIAAAGMIGLIAMVGLVIDTGILFIEYGRLKRGVDAAAISAAQNYHTVVGGTAFDYAAVENAARNFLQLNQADVMNIEVHSCEDLVVADRPNQCNPDPLITADNRKLVEVSASKLVEFGFLKVIGIRDTTIRTFSVGEAASIDLVMIVDTSESMSWSTSPTGSQFASDAGDDPHACNIAGNCEPLERVKFLAREFIDTLYFPYDRVALVSMTSRYDRSPVEVLPLTSVKGTVATNIDNLMVYETPRECDGSTTPGACRLYDPSHNFLVVFCQAYYYYISQNPQTTEEWDYYNAGDWVNFDAAVLARNALADPSACPSSNIGGALRLASAALIDPALTRLESFWSVVLLAGGPANATDVPQAADFASLAVPAGFTDWQDYIDVFWPNGFCPWNAQVPDDYPDSSLGLPYPYCVDMNPDSRHTTDTLSYIHPYRGSGVPYDIPLYDAEDYSRDQADLLAGLTEEGVTIYTIGLGAEIRDVSLSDTYYCGLACDPIGDPTQKIPPAEYLLKYIAEEAGPADMIHGQYFFAPTEDALRDIFEQIANNLATRISQ